MDEKHINITSYISNHDGEKGFLTSKTLEDISIKDPEAKKAAEETLVCGDYMYLPGYIDIKINGYTILGEEDWTDDIVSEWESICDFIVKSKENDPHEIFIFGHHNRYYFELTNNLIQIKVNRDYIRSGLEIFTHYKDIPYVEFKKAAKKAAEEFYSFCKDLPFGEEASFDSFVETYELLRKVD
ncbi:hypothetical protein P4631_10415 [Halalkalibacterium halodurans]|uniref:BH0324 protein n=1 Tax=Halalkalibacterium halodurans (strain ATCC BAA-125 / DSM 18197 / FERM 7344 / JCM 9153 / C-125) TaxID=272558 RepID=Q9KFZ2_HALH5|nr:hypothetical protein [Halalkalibacterium halodurans]MED4172844.1 hypothetical protein [Halalkalibacterium halodurans]BAB04043.1 BH0324 [Halalkalibacterium halodurans C-125]